MKEILCTPHESTSELTVMPMHEVILYWYTYIDTLLVLQVRNKIKIVIITLCKGRHQSMMPSNGQQGYDFLQNPKLR